MLSLGKNMCDIARRVGIKRQAMYENTTGMRTPRKVLFLKGVIALLREQMHGHTETPLVMVRTGTEDFPSCVPIGYTASDTISITEVKDTTGLSYVRVSDIKNSTEIKIYGNEGVSYFPATLAKEKVA